MLFNCCDGCGTMFVLKRYTNASRDIKANITELTYHCPNPTCLRSVIILKRETQEDFEKNLYK